MGTNLLHGKKTSTTATLILVGAILTLEYFHTLTVAGNNCITPPIIFKVVEPQLSRHLGSMASQTYQNYVI